MERLVTEGSESGDVPSIKPASKHMREVPTHKPHKAIIAAIVVLVLAGVLGAAYGVGYYYFSAHYYPGTYVAGVDATGLTEDELVQAVDSTAQSYSAKVGNGSYELAFSSGDIDLSWDSRTLAQTLLQDQDVAMWPLDLVNANVRTESNLGFEFNDQKLWELVSESVASYNQTAKQPVSAKLALNEQKDAFSLVPEETGTALDAAAVYCAAADCVKQGSPGVQLTEAACVQPAYKEASPSTAAALERANKALKTSIPLARGDTIVMDLIPSTFVPWLKTQDDLTLTIDKDAATAWADDYLWEVADYSDDANAYVVDPAAFAVKLSEVVESNSFEPMQLSYKAVVRHLPGGGVLNPTAWDASVGRYIDINKKSQVACLYDATGRVLWESVVTTGNEAAKHGTPTGRFAIYDKKTDFMLIGFDENNDGKPDYERHVDYWMPFHLGIGLHDASWRTVYGGTEYLNNGSGGCVNLPHDAAESLYAMAHEDDVVIVHD